MMIERLWRRNSARLLVWLLALLPSLGFSANDFYSHASGVPSTGSLGSSATMRAEFDSVAGGFDKLPSLSGNADLPVFINSGATGLTAISASSARTKLGLGSIAVVNSPVPIANGGTGATDAATAIANLGINSLPVGTILDFAGSVAPTGYLTCDGSAVSRTTYSALYAVIGTTWGSGDGSTTFNLPDFRRRVAVGSGGTGTATLGNTVGSTGGEETHTLTTSEMPSHSHGVTDPGHGHSINDPGHSHTIIMNGSNGSSNSVSGPTLSTPQNLTLTNPAFTGITINSNTTGISIQNAGGGGAHNNMQPSAVVTKIIKF